MGLLTRLRFAGASARYYSQSPLFPLSECRQAIAPGTYDNQADGTRICLLPHLDYYHVSGDATPETVALIPLGSEPSRYIFQQSAGLGVTFYGTLRTVADAPGFRLLSPESVRWDAIGFASRHGASVGRSGCCFSHQNDVFTALVLLMFDAPEACWNRYVPEPITPP